MKAKKEITCTLKNNNGVTLVELIIAMTLLSIVVAIICRGFILSARVNAKAKIQHKATSLAQNILEGMKAEDLDSILYQFSCPETKDEDGNVVAKNFKIVNNAYESVGPENGYAKYEEIAGKTVLTYNYPADSNYSFSMNKVKMENSEFDVEIFLNGERYTDTGSSGQTYNSTEVSHIPNMDSSLDAIVSGAMGAMGAAGDVDMAALSYFKSLNTAVDINMSDISRKITVDIDEYLNAVAKKCTKVTAEYEYTYNGMTYTPSSITKLVYDNSGDKDGVELRNVFIFYMPNYGKEDEIIINNKKNRDVNVFLVKLKNSSLSEVELASKEITYSCKISVNDNTSSPIDKGFLKLHTNVLPNISDSPYGSGAKQGTLFYNGIQLTNLEKAGKIGFSDLSNAMKEDRILDATINVYYSGELKASITGSIRN